MKVLHGNKDVIEVLEDALKQAKAGELVGVIICGITDGDGINTGGCGWQGGIKEGTLFPYSRLLASVTGANKDLIADGIADWQ